MTLRLFIRPVFAFLLIQSAWGQQIYGAGSGLDADQQSLTKIPNRAEVLRLIAIYEAAARRAESAHETNAVVATVSMRLASLYEDAGMHDQSEAALERAISLLRRNRSGVASWLRA